MGDIGTIINGRSKDGTWYKIPNFEGGEVLIRMLNPKEKRELFEKSTIRRIRGGRTHEYQDLGVANREAVKIAVLDWRGLQKDGEDYPVTDENKVELSDRWDKFFDLWTAVVFPERDLELELVRADQGN